MGRGDTVLVRAFRDMARVARVWAVTLEAVYICNDEQFERRSNHLEALDPVGFPRRDVFVYDSALYARLREGTAQWDDFERYTALPCDAWLIDSTRLRCLHCAGRQTIDPDAAAVTCATCGAVHTLNEEPRIENKHEP